MEPRGLFRSRLVYAAMGGVAALHIVASCVGITWGLPSRAIDRYLFGSDSPWSGETIYRLAGADAKFSTERGADVDADPLPHTVNEPINLTSTQQDVAKIYLRYRLYTYQPDEMITMMALKAMRPGQFDFDPKLYQYGGLFIYPVAALIKLCGLLGLIDVRGDVIYYLDHPDEFGKFYVVARAYSAAFGLVGAIILFCIARRLAGDWAGVLAALFFVLMPVVVCMSHEGKPHLPGAVLMLIAVWLAMQTRAEGFSPRPYWLMCVCCGAAVGMVLSSWPIFVLIPLVAWMSCRRREEPVPGPPGLPLRSSAGACGSDAVPLLAQRALMGRSLALAARKTLAGFALATAVYLVTNPYIVINLFANREVLRSNFGNSLAMYRIDRIGEGFLNVIDLTAEGATWPIVFVGVAAAIWSIVKRRWDVLPIALPALLFFIQFVLIGAGKPGEYGRFGIFTNSALALGGACGIMRCGKWLRWFGMALGLMTIAVLTVNSSFYLNGFHLDAAAGGSRIRMAEELRRIELSDRADGQLRLALISEPAPYSCPPLPFEDIDLYLFASMHDVRDAWMSGTELTAALRTKDRFFAQRESELTSRAVTDVDGKPIFVRFLPSVSREESMRVTPISWADKPVEFFPNPPIVDR